MLSELTILLKKNLLKAPLPLKFPNFSNDFLQGQRSFP